MALDKLGYSPDESAEVAAYIEEKNSVVGAPYVKTDTTRSSTARSASARSTTWAT